MEENQKTPEKKKTIQRGLVILNTGWGKGKTTAALGCALRAAGHEQNVLILQFIKGGMKTGEVKSLEYLKPFIEIRQLGRGFIKYKDGKPVITQDDIINARTSFKIAETEIYSNKYDLIILDEIINLLNFKLIEIDELKDLIEKRPFNLNLILTGSNAPLELINIADTATEMRPLKHAFEKGITARKGIEF